MILTPDDKALIARLAAPSRADVVKFDALVERLRHADQVLDLSLVPSVDLTQALFARYDYAVITLMRENDPKPGMIARFRHWQGRNHETCVGMALAMANVINHALMAAEMPHPDQPKAGA